MKMETETNFTLMKVFDSKNMTIELKKDCLEYFRGIGQVVGIHTFLMVITKLVYNKTTNEEEEVDMDVYPRYKRLYDYFLKNGANKGERIIIMFFSVVN